MMHVRAVGDMIQRLGPEAFSIGTMHTIFVGFRPLLVGYKLLHRLLGTMLTPSGGFLAVELDNLQAGNISCASGMDH